MHDVDPIKTRKKSVSTGEKFFYFGDPRVARTYGLAVPKLSYDQYRIKQSFKFFRGRRRNQTVEPGTVRNRCRGARDFIGPRIDVSGVQGGLHSDGYFRYNGTVRNAGKKTANDLVLSVEIFDFSSRKLVGRDTQIYPELPPAAHREVHGSMSVPSSTSRVRMKVNVENYPASGQEGDGQPGGEGRWQGCSPDGRIDRVARWKRRACPRGVQRETMTGEYLAVLRWSAFFSAPCPHGSGPHVFAQSVGGSRCRIVGAPWPPAFYKRHCNPPMHHMQCPQGTVFPRQSYSKGYCLPMMSSQGTNVQLEQ